MLGVNYAGTFGTQFSNDEPVSLEDHHIDIDSAGAPGKAGPAHHDTILIPNAQLLFAGDFNRLGNNLMLSKDGHQFLVEDYFRGEKRATLASPDGANLSGNVVQALTGHIQYAQAGGTQSAPKDIGQVSKLVGTATVIRNGVLVELHGGDRVYKGDVVQAGANSACTIVFVDGSVFGLSANARMVLNEMVYDQAGTANSALISLVRGTVSFVAGETAKHGDMKVETPVATMGIRGTAVLVEIGFEIPSDGKGPPVNFQVLVEPDGTTGSYIIYSKSDPTMVIGTIDKAGQIYSVSGNGTFSNLPSTEMSQVAAAIIQQVFTQRFQGYVPDKPVSTPQSGGGGGGSPPPSPPDNNIPKLNDTPGGGPVIVPITIQIPDGSGGTKTVTIPVGVGVSNTPPTISVQDVVTDAQNFTFKIADRVTITDPDATNSFHDVAVPYVSGTATLISAIGPPGLPSTIHLNQLVTIDPQTGAVSYDHNAFGFLKQGQQVIITIGFDSKSGPDTVHETLHLIIDGVNDPPVIDSVSLSVFKGKAVVLNSSDIHVSDPDSTAFTFNVSNVHGGEFQVTTDGIHWCAATSFTSAELADGHVRFLADHSGDTPTFNIVPTDDSGLSGQSFSGSAHLESVTHLENADVSIDLSAGGATNGFTFHGAGNVTTPGTPEDRIALGYHINIDGQDNTVIHNGAPMQGVDEFGHICSTTDAQTNSVITKLDAGHDVTLTQTVTLGTDANYFTTTIKIANDGDTDITGVSFLRNIDPDQDVAVNGNYQTFNQVLQNPTLDEHLAAVSATGPTSGVNVVLIGLGSDWHATFYGSGLVHDDPYDPNAFGATPNPTTSDQSITLIDNVGTVAAHSSVEITYLTTANVATNGDNALIGTSGNDTINGLGGNDLLIGLGGADTFVFAKGSGHDTILDFTTGTDKIELDGLSSIPTNTLGQFTETELNQMKASNAITTVNGGTLIHLDGTDTIMLQNVKIDNLHANDFIIHPGPSA